MRLCLIVNESRAERKSAREMLHLLAFRVAEASDGVAGLVACVREMPDLILLDPTDPILSEILFLHTLRGLPDGGLPRVIFCATQGGVARIAQVMEAGADDYLIKPFYAELLRQKLAGLGL